MHETLESMKDAWDNDTGGGRNEALTRSLADQFVASNPGLFTDHLSLTQAQCVSAIDVFRAANMEEELLRMQAWLFHRFEPKNIGGEMADVIRVVG
jgi:hypothetical protein